MSNRQRTKTEAGQGGKLGHSNMAHWDLTEVIKSTSRKKRRRQDKVAIARETLDLHTQAPTIRP